MTVRLRSHIKTFTNVLLYEVFAAVIAFWMVFLLMVLLIELGY
jgi:hypothetical protein